MTSLWKFPGISDTSRRCSHNSSWGGWVLCLYPFTCTRCFRCVCNVSAEIIQEEPFRIKRASRMMVSNRCLRGNVNHNAVVRIINANPPYKPARLDDRRKTDLKRFEISYSLERKNSFVTICNLFASAVAKFETCSFGSTNDALTVELQTCTLL